MAKKPVMIVGYGASEDTVKYETTVFLEKHGEARIIGVAMDGAFDRIGLFIAIPVVVFLILLAAHKLLDKAHGAENATV